MGYRAESSGCGAHVPKIGDDFRPHFREGRRSRSSSLNYINMKKAFTLLETMIVIAIIAVLGVVAFFSLQGGKSETDLTGTIQQMTTLLRQAQSSAVSQKTSHRL